MTENRNVKPGVLRQRLDDFLKTRRGDGKKYVFAIIRAVAASQAYSPEIRDDYSWASHRKVHADVSEDVPHGKTVHRILQDLVKNNILEETSDDVSEFAPVKRKRYYRVPLDDPLAIILTAEELRFYSVVLRERDRVHEMYIQRNIALKMLRERGIEFPEHEMYRRYAKAKGRSESHGYHLAALILDGGPGYISVPKERFCEECGADMTGRNASARFCSSACRQAHYRKSKKN